jgi:hypothetical protein
VTTRPSPFWVDTRLVRQRTPFRGFRSGRAGSTPGKPVVSPAGLGGTRHSRRSDHPGGSRVYRGSPSVALHRRTCGASEDTERGRSTLACCCPPWPSCCTLADVRTLPSRTLVLVAVQPVGCIRLTLMTFAPSFPTRPDLAAQLLAEMSFLSWGCPKIAPPSSLVGESTPGGRARASPRSSHLRDGKCQPPILVPPSWFSTTSTVSSSLRRRADPCGPHLLRADVACMLQHASDPGVHDVSAIQVPRQLLRTDSTPRPTSSSCSSALRSFLSRHSHGDQTSWRGVTTSPPREVVTPTAGRPTVKFTNLLALSPFTPAPSMGSCLHTSDPGARPQGLAPCQGSLSIARLPARSTRCSHGLERCSPPPALPLVAQVLRVRRMFRQYVKDRSKGSCENQERAFIPVSTV